MSEIKISQLSSATSMSGTETLMCIQSGVNKKFQLSTLLANLNSASNIQINPSKTAITTSIYGTNNTPLISCQGSSVTIDSNISITGNISLSKLVVCASEIKSSASAINPTVETTFLNLPTGSTAFTLAAGTDNQTKKIAVYSSVNGASASITLTGQTTGLVNVINIPAPANGKGIYMVYKTGAGWIIVGNNGCTFTTVP